MLSVLWVGYVVLSFGQQLDWNGHLFIFFIIKLQLFPFDSECNDKEDAGLARYAEDHTNPQTLSKIF